MFFILQIKLNTMLVINSVFLLKRVIFYKDDIDRI